MRFIHLSDLHLGKLLGNYSLIEDQKFILNEILGIIDKENISGVLISGDIYDKSIASVEAINMFSDFLTKLHKRNLNVFVISGNHDSSDRLSFGNEILRNDNVFISSTYNGEVEKVSLNDEFGNINIYMLPFIKPIHVKKQYESSDIETYNDAVKFVISKVDLNKDERNIILCHQYVDGAERSDSEDKVIGGLDMVDSNIFKDFDYVALGHIHKSQSFLNGKVRYSGTPLKYSFSEAGNNKSVTIISINEKNNIDIKEVELVPLRDMKNLRGEFNSLTNPENYEKSDFVNSYLRITLTDEDEVPNAMNILRSIYKYIVSLDYDNSKRRMKKELDSKINVEEKTPFELFSTFFKEQNNRDLTEVEGNFIKDKINKIWEEE